MVLLIKLKVLLILCKITTGFDYCTIESCNQGEHTMCKFPDDKVACAGDGVKTGLTDELRKAILDRHNTLRQTVALGKQSPQPAAGNMMKLTWHDEAEKIAQRWANQCISNHDSCRNMENSKVGQNMASYGATLKSPEVKETILKMVNMWYDEVKHFDKDKVDRFEFNFSTGHYTQVVWAETTAIGCGFIQKPENSFVMLVLFCNYVPAGNYRNNPIYKRSKACSECPEGTKCSKKYPGLCSKDPSDFGGDPKDLAKDIAISHIPSLFVLLLSSTFVFWSSFIVIKP